VKREEEEWKIEDYEQSKDDSVHSVAWAKVSLKRQTQKEAWTWRIQNTN